MAPRLTGRDILDFSLTLRENAYLPWRETGARDAAGRPTQFRANGLVGGHVMTMIQDLTYYADNHASYPGLLSSDLWSITGPDGGAALYSQVTVEFLPLYNASLEQTGENVKLNGVLVTYT